MAGYSRQVDIKGKTAQELYDKVSGDIENFMSKTPIGKVEVGRIPDKKQVTIKSSMLTATLFCEEGKIRIDAKLGLMAMPFKSKIDEGIDKWLAKTFQV